jgi:hypothetical protein
VITCAHCGHEFSSALAACPVCHIPVNGIPQWLFRGRAAAASTPVSGQPPVTANDVVETAPTPTPAPAPAPAPVAIPATIIPAKDGSAVVVDEAKEPAADEDVPGTEAMVDPSLGPHAEVASVFAAGSGEAGVPVTAPGDAPLGSLTDAVAEAAEAAGVEVEPPSFNLDPPTFMTEAPDAPPEVVDAAADLGEAAEAAHPEPDSGPATETPAEAVAEPEPEPASLGEAPDLSQPAEAPPAETTGPVAVPAPEATPPPTPPTPPAEPNETTLRLQDVLPNSGGRGPSLFGIPDQSNAQLPSDILNSASRLRAPLDQSVSPGVPAWQQPMGTAISSSLSSASLTSGLGNFQAGADDLFRSRRVPSAADVTAAATGTPPQFGQPATAAAHEPTPTAPATPAPPAQPVSAATPALFAQPTTAPTPYPPTPETAYQADPYAPPPAPVPGPGTYDTPAAQTYQAVGSGDDGHRPPPAPKPKKRGRGGLIAGIIAIIAGLGLIAVLMWYLFNQWSESPEPPPDPETSAATTTPTATPTPTPTPTPSDTPTPTPEEPVRPAGAIPDDTDVVCEDNALGVMAPGTSCVAARELAAVIPVEAAGEFSVNAYITPRGANEDFACRTLDTYYQCTLLSSEIDYRIAFGREGR